VVLRKKAVYVERAPAKINLFLDVLAKRKDGYHNIKTVFQAINLEDFLTFEISVEVAENQNEISEAIDFELEIDSDQQEVRELGLSNLVTRAVEAYFASIPASDDKADLIDMISLVKISVFIDKHIPMQAGLAGASADAAATLRALNKFFYENFNWSLSEKELLEIALTIGSDVPFCLRSLKQCRLYAESRGEKFKEILIDFDFDSFSQVLVVKPKFGIETAHAYSLLSEYKIKRHKQIEFYNAFENPIFDNYPQLLEIQQLLLEAGCDYVLLSGSGSSMLGFVNKEKNLKAMAQKLARSLPDSLVYESKFNDPVTEK
jgi:4-diphosphocytidyl-2-C-methyl-D-erythritol kinase